MTPGAGAYVGTKVKPAQEALRLPWRSPGSSHLRDQFGFAQKIKKLMFSFQNVSAKIMTTIAPTVKAAGECALASDICRDGRAFIH